ncbi:MAG: hypothetical protein ACYC5S_08535 [Thiobacillus sp.]
MQFLFGMALLELIVKMTMWYVRAHIWVAKWILRTSWRSLRVAVRQIQHAIEIQRSNRVFRAASEKRGEV